MDRSVRRLPDPRWTRSGWHSAARARYNVSLAQIPDTQLLDAAFLPPAPGLEPAIVLYAPRELNPGVWRRAEEALAVPEYARRLTLPLGDPLDPRIAQTRALSVGEAIPFLIELAQVDLRPSAKAWVIAAHIARRIHEGAMLPRGNEKTDAILGRIAAGMPPSSHAVLVELAPDADDPLSMMGPNGDQPSWGKVTAREALEQFLDIAQHAYALGAAQQRTPVKRGNSKTLAGLAIRLDLPRGRDGRWHALVQRADFETDDAKLRNALTEGAQIWTPLERAIHAGLTDPLELTVDEASALIMAAPDLMASGAGVQLPEELTLGMERQVHARIRFRGDNDDGSAPSADDEPGPGGRRGRSVAGSSGPPRFRLEDLVAYDIDVALGDTKVSAEELRKIARQAGSLVQMGGEWVALTDASREQLERLARAVEATDAHMANSTALAASLGGEAILPGGIKATVDRVDEAALHRAVEFLKNPTAFEEIESPKGFLGELRPYQQKGLSWLAGMAGLPLGAVLADDMGLGKTVQIIALLQHVRHERVAAGSEAGRVLVTCPTSLIGNWQRELERFAPELDVHVHHGPMREARASQLDGHDVVLTSYGLVARDREMLAAIDWSVVIFDEAQAVKNPDTEQARAVRMLRAPVRIALTGTPLENRLLELWSLLDLVNPGLLGTASVFNKRFAGPIERAGDEQAAATLRALTRPFMLRRVKHDPEIVPDLPEKQERTVACTLTPEQAALYQATADSAMAEVRNRDGIGRRGAVLALLTRLKQICNNPMQALGQKAGESGVDDEPYVIEGRSGKLDRLEAMLGEIVAEDDRALVFTQNAQMGHLLAAHLPDVLGCEVLYLHGGVPRLKREELVAKFQASEKPMVFVLSLKAGGLGLNLMNASHVFHFDRWWNPAVEDQATDRTHRIGQTRGIQVHKLVCAGTLEERIAQIIDEKRALAGKIIETSGATGEGWITELDDDALAELVKLGKDAMADEGIEADDGGVPA
ncbi:MAG: helZ [Thermoleophilia bacterium]|nr:helZ [Thermoleophilia bacterium]